MSVPAVVTVFAGPVVPQLAAGTQAVYLCWRVHLQPFALSQLNPSVSRMIGGLGDLVASCWKNLGDGKTVSQCVSHGGAQEGHGSNQRSGSPESESLLSLLKKRT